MAVCDSSAIERWSSQSRPQFDFLPANSAMAQQIETKNWSQTPLGPISTWNDQLRNSVRSCLASEEAVGVVWGAGRVQIYNDEFRRICGDLHPEALGKDHRESWSPHWPALCAALDQAIDGVSVSCVQHQRLLLSFQGIPEESFITFTFSPILDEAGHAVGVVQTLDTTTDLVQGQRRFATLQRLGESLGSIASVDELLAAAVACLAGNPVDHPFVALYRRDSEAGRFCLVDSANISNDHTQLPDCLDAGLGRLWRLSDVIAAREPVIIDDLVLPQTAEAGQLSSAALLPVTRPGCQWPLEFLLCAINPLCKSKSSYHQYYNLLYSVIELGCRAQTDTNSSDNKGVPERMQTPASALPDDADRYTEIVERLQFAFSRAQIGEWVLHVDNDVAYCSEQFNRCLGYESSPEWNFEKFLAHVHPEDRERIQIAYNLMREDGRDWHAEFRVVWPDDTTHWLSGHGGVYRQTDKETRLVGIVMDISVRKFMEETVRTSSERKDEFLATLAHELRNPLAPISAAAEMLDVLATRELPDQASKSQLASVARVIGRQVRHMTELIEDLLDVSRVSRGLVSIQHGAVAIHHVVSAAVEQVRSLAAAKGQHIDLSGCEHLCSTDLVTGDEKRLVQILSNLLVNAVRYTPDEGNISCSVQRVRGGSLDQRGSGEKLLLIVEDDGAGMEADFQNSIFELFSQQMPGTDRTQSGLGIGLALVRKLAQLHGGDVLCFSNGPGTGSRFTVSLPALELSP